MSLHTTARNLLLANLEWSNDAVDISVEPISLIERGRRLPFVNEEKKWWTRVRKFREKRLCMRVETNRGIGKDI